MRDPETAPFQYLHAGSTDHENYRVRERADPRGRRPRRRTTTRSSGCCRATSARARLLRRVPRRAAATRRPCRACAGTSRNDGWHESPCLAAAGRTRAAPVPRRRRQAVSAPGAGRRRRGGLAARPGEPRARRRSSTRSRSCSSTRTRARSRRSARRRRVHERAARRAADARRPGRRPPSGGQRRAVDVRARQARGRGPGRGVAHPALRPGARRAPRRTRRRCRVYLGHTGHRVLPGHRLRLQVASSDYPLYVPHPGTSESPWFAVETAVNHQHVLTGGPTPSHVSLSVLERVDDRTPDASACLRSFSPSGSAGTMVRMSSGSHA